jgi:cysteinyl-tRNA synthetase
MLGKLFKPSKQAIRHREINLFNSESNSLEVFTPLKAPRVTMYTCGLTVYDYATIGNLRSFVFADIVKRTLIMNGFAVEHTINFTDFGHLSDDGDNGEDKMTRGLKREGLPVTLEAMRELSDTYIDAFLDDLSEMRVMGPTTWARASEYVRKQISLIKALDDKGFIYEASDGWYFDISKFPTYGRLGKIDLTKLKSGARVETNSEKKQPADFAVWKKSDLGWDSRFGKGFPGWHMECSAMAMATLGKQIDIHTGGEDLAPVHHNAEIAQCEAVTGKQFVKYWLHSAFITIENNKIGKSLGNAITLRHLADRGFSGDDYRYWLLTAHYRSPANFTWEALKGSKQALFRLKRYMYEEYKRKVAVPSSEYLEQFHGHLANDFDTPAALAVLWEVVKDDSLSNETKAGTLVAMDEILQIGLSEPVDEGVRQLGVISQADIPAEVQALIDEREAARIAQNWTEADRLREAIKLKGYSVEDSATGPKVSKV